MKKIALAAVVAAGVLAPAGEARSFIHVVKPGETLAQIAQRVYGDAKLESALIDANTLDAYGGAKIAPGLPLEIPAPDHYKVQKGETWYTLAQEFLGDSRRSVLLSRLNGGDPWVPPVDGKEIVVPAVVRHIGGENETINMIWDRYMPDPGRAWELNNYNFREGNTLPLRRGEVILVPLTALTLTTDGKAEATRAKERECSQGAGLVLDQQRKAEAEMPALSEDMRNGMYADVVARGNRLIGMGVLTKPDLATIYRALVESYVALDATGAAIGACASYKANALDLRLDPTMTSPKILSACGML
jgi:LysM repeat protein